MSKTLTISPIPFRSSYLAMEPVQFSPQMPLTPPTTPSKSQMTAIKLPSTPAVPPPKNPLDWLWQCHLCHRTYRLGVTQRCLDDGHRFCPGVTVVSRRGTTKKVKHHKACASEFDYAGWRAWGDWRRTLAEIDAMETIAVENCISPLFGRGVDVETPVPERKAHKDCWNTCNYPSECRWGKQSNPLTMATLPSCTAAAMVEARAHDKAASPLAEFEKLMAEMTQIQSVEEAMSVPVNETADEVLLSVVASAKQRKQKTESSGSVWERAATRVVEHRETNEDREETEKGEVSQTSVPVTLLGKANGMLSTVIDGWRSRSPSPGAVDKKTKKGKDKVVSGGGGRGRRLEKV